MKTIEEKVLDPKYLEEILGSFSKATELHIEAVNKKGETFSIPGGMERCEFCRLIRSYPKGEKRCMDSYKRAGLEAAKWEEPYFFRCHAGLVIWAVPIVINNVSYGSIICGQVLMWDPDKFFFQELKKLTGGMADLTVLQETAAQIGIVSPDRSQAAADMLFVVVNHLVMRNIHVLAELDAHKHQQEQLRRDLEERKHNPGSGVNNYTAYLKKERRFLQYIRLGDRTRAGVSLQSLLTDLYTKTMGDKRAIKARMLELATLVSRAAVEGGADAESAMVMRQEFNAVIEGIDKVEEVFYKTDRIVEQFLENIFALADKKHLSLVKEARNFILENYSRTLIIEDVANHLFISPSHLCRLFREELDTTINDYLTRVRVEKAVELMKKPELSVEQVSKAVGFKNQSCLAKVFRKYIGVTPLTYRNSLF
jgi:two-component system, response regulator YesN